MLAAGHRHIRAVLAGTLRHGAFRHAARQLSEQAFEHLKVKAPTPLKAERRAVVGLHEIQAPIKTRVFLPAHVQLAKQRKKAIQCRSATTHPAIEVIVTSDLVITASGINRMDVGTIAVADQHEGQGRAQVAHGDVQATAQVRHRVQHLEPLSQARAGNFVLETAGVVQGITTVLEVAALAD